MLVFRDSGSHSKLLRAFLGSGEHYVAVIGEAEYTAFKLPPGRHVLRAKGQASVAAKLELTLSENTKTCIRLVADPAQWGAVVMPFLAMGIPAFKLSRVNCPSEEALRSYKFVPAPPETSADPTAPPTGLKTPKDSTPP